MNDMEFAVRAVFGARTVIASVDTQEDQVVFLQHDNPSIPLNQRLCFTEYIQRVKESGTIYPSDESFFDVLLDLQELRECCCSRKTGSLFSFRKQVDGRIRWARVLLHVPEDYSAENPRVLLSMRYLSEQEADEQDAAQIVRNTICKVFKYDFVTNSLRMLKEPRGERNMKMRYRESGENAAQWQEEFFVHPDDQEVFRSAADRERIRAWFEAGNTTLELFYRRKFMGLYRWVKLVIQPATECTREHPVFLFYVVDVHKSMTVFSTRSVRSQLIEKNRPEEVETYYDNIMNALSFFTQQYKDFYIVDLVKDRYIKYKVDREAVIGAAPYVGCYSEMAAKYLAEVVSEGTEGKDMSRFASLDELRSILEDKVSFDYFFTMPDGRRYRTICTRIESENSVPTKMIFRTVPEVRGELLRVKTFGSFEVYDRQGHPITFTKKKSKQLLAYLIDKYGFPAATADIVQDVLEKDADDLNAKKYVSTLFRMAAKDLEQAGYPDVIRKEWNSLRVDVDKLDCDYYHLMEGDVSYWGQYHNEYMKEYSWAEETNAELLQYDGI